ncbi:PQ loop repeat-domain-containing protein, partial [Trametes maxima]
MPANRAAENALGTIGTVCWTIQLLPQIWYSYRMKSTEGLSEWLMLTWGIAGAFLGTYSVVQGLNIPLILQPQLFGVLSFVSWAQCQYYAHKRSKVTVVAMFVAAVAIFGGFEAGMIFAIFPSFRAGKTAPVRFFGIFSTVLISGALLPQFYEIYRYKEVVGISLLFMSVDLLGGIFNDLSLAFKADFDIVAGVTYSMVILLDGIVILLALTLNPLARRRR